MNFDFEKFKKTCTDIDKVMDLRNETDRKAFTAYMKKNKIRYTDPGAQYPFVWFDSADYVFGMPSAYHHTTIYSFHNFLLPEFNIDNVLEFLESE